ncbi:hypothetical protein JCM8097_008157 [Rhodosporidiobolus ruineniae]
MNGPSPSSSSAHGNSSSSAAVAAGDAAGRKRVTLVDAPAGGETPPPSKKARLAKMEESDEEDDKPEEDVKLENFRKEALYRELVSYKRQLARAQAECESLRTQRAACEIRISRVEMGWQEVVDEAERAIPGTGAIEAEAATSPDLTDPSLSDEALEAALSQRTSATRALLARLQSLPSSSSTSTPSALETKTRTLLSDALASREALRVLRADRDRTLEELEQTHAQLVRAEKRFDRFQSATVAAVEGRAVPKDVLRAAAGGSGSGGASPAGPAASGQSPLPNGAVKAEDAAGPSDPGGTGAVASTAVMAAAGIAGAAEQLSELEELRDVVQKRGAELEQLREERIGLKLEIDSFKGKLVDLPDDIVAETATFRLMQQHVQYLAAEYETKRQEAERAVKEAEELKEGMEAFRDGVFHDATEQVTDLQTRLSGKESDLSRLRSARDDLKAEAVELRAKESDRTKTLDELRVLAEARSQRLKAYASEVRRLRIGKAADEGKPDEVDARVRLAEAAAGAEDEDGAEEGEVEDDLVADLQSRLRKAEALLLALRDQLSQYAAAAQASTGMPSAGQLVESEMKAREELQRAQARLEKLDRLLGPGGEVEVRALTEKLREKDDEVRKAEAKVKSQEAATNMLYGEIERLSTAWGSLDEQNANKIFNLSSLEDKIQRLNADKAKADNRYFATMRQKDAIASENTVLTKLAEKQQQKVDAANEIHRSISGQLTAAEKEITLHQKNVRAYQDDISRLKRENAELTLRSDQTLKQLAELNAALFERITQAESEAALRSKADERVSKLERQLQQAQEKLESARATKAAAGAADPTEVRELKQYNADLSRMLKCQTCQLRLKEVVLTRCGHCFCKPCVDARLTNRSRKCPSCQTPFGNQDTLVVFF